MKMFVHAHLHVSSCMQENYYGENVCVCGKGGCYSLVSAQQGVVLFEREGAVCLNAGANVSVRSCWASDYCNTPQA